MKTAHETPESDQSQDGQPVALITGATGGLGGAVTRAFQEAGVHVIGTHRKAAGTEEAEGPLPGSGRGQGGLVLYQVDVTDAAAVAQLVRTTVARFGRIDYLINLVGGWAGGQPVWETSDEALDRMLALNLRSTFVCSRAVLPQMIERRFGRIVSVSSRAAVRPAAGGAPYAMSKAAVITLTETLALEVQEHDITANCVLPSVIDTPANRRTMPGADFTRWVRPEQLAAIIRWLTSPDAAAINGAAIPVYGRA